MVWYSMGSILATQDQQQCTNWKPRLFYANHCCTARESTTRRRAVRRSLVATSSRTPLSIFAEEWGVASLWYTLSAMENEEMEVGRTVTVT
jgi:hypothetical protein